jgi:hypothetical protein
MVFYYEGDVNTTGNYWITNQRRRQVCEDKSWLAYDEDHANCQAACDPLTDSECATWNNFHLNRVRIDQVGFAQKKLWKVVEIVRTTATSKCHYWRILPVPTAGSCMAVKPYVLT